MKIRIVVQYLFGDYYVDFVKRLVNNPQTPDDYLCNSIKLNDMETMETKISIDNQSFVTIVNFTYKKYRKIANENKH